jgi:hypothetical protein
VSLQRGMGEKANMPIRKELASMLDLERARGSFLSDQFSTAETILLNSMREIDLHQRQPPKLMIGSVRNRCSQALIQVKAGSRRVWLNIAGELRMW